MEHKRGLDESDDEYLDLLQNLPFDSKCKFYVSDTNNHRSTVIWNNSNEMKHEYSFMLTNI
jgi:hypothetical protein